MSTSGREARGADKGDCPLRRFGKKIKENYNEMNSERALFKQKEDAQKFPTLASVLVQLLNTNILFHVYFYRAFLCLVPALYIWPRFYYRQFLNYAPITTTNKKEVVAKLGEFRTCDGLFIFMGISFPLSFSSCESV